MLERAKPGTSTFAHTRGRSVRLYRSSSAAAMSTSASNIRGSPTMPEFRFIGLWAHTRSPRRTAASKAATCASLGQRSKPGLSGQPSGTLHGTQSLYRLTIQGWTV